MSNHNSKKSHRQGDQRAGQSVHCYQSIWMARLTQTSGSISPQGQNGFSLSMSNSDGDAKKFTEITDMRTIRIRNEGVAITERLDSQSFPLFNIFQNNGCGVDSENGFDNFCNGQVSRPQFNLKNTNESGRVSQFLEEPSTQIIPYRSNKGKAPELSFMGRHVKVKHLTLGSGSKQDLSNANILDTKHDRNHDLRNFSILGHDKKWDDYSASGKFGTSFLRLCNTSADSNLLPVFAGETSKEMKSFPFLVKETKSVKLSHSIHDLETIEILDANSVDGIAGGRAAFSQTTHNLLYTDKSDNKKSKQDPGIKESSDSLNSNRNMFSQLLSLSPPSSLGKKGVKIQLLDSSSESQENHDVRGILNHNICQKNESSADTATMDMETFKQHTTLSGVNSYVSNKNLSKGHDPPSQSTIVSDRKKIEHKQARTRLPDMNEIPIIQISSSSMENTEPSTSKTQSLDAEHLHFNNDPPTNHKTSRFPNGPPTIEPITTLEPGSRWLKRLKLNVSQIHGIGTKSSNIEEVLSHRKVNKLLSKAVVGSKTCRFKQAFNEYNSKKEIIANQSAIIVPPKKDIDILLSHSWIKRWCRDATQKKKLESVVVCEPQSTKMDFSELQNKQFPSIGAMALMGKALKGFQPCELRKMGSFVVWDMKGL